MNAFEKDFKIRINFLSEIVDRKKYKISTNGLQYILEPSKQKYQKIGII